MILRTLTNHHTATPAKLNALQKPPLAHCMSPRAIPRDALAVRAIAQVFHRGYQSWRLLYRL